MPERADGAVLSDVALHSRSRGHAGLQPLVRAVVVRRMEEEARRLVDKPFRIVNARGRDETAFRVHAGEDVSETLAFLARDDASYITSETIYPDGGRRVLNCTAPVKE